jgi:hypothetical protein
LKGRRRLFGALAEQKEVDVVVYLPLEPGPSEWDDQFPETPSSRLPNSARPGSTCLHVAADARREAEWVAEQVRTLLEPGELKPHEIAVVVRTGSEDTGRLVGALEEVGVPSTARSRWVLADIAALRSLLLLFRGAANDWDYRSLRNLLASPYFQCEVDLRSVDFIARERRVRGLEQWTGALRRLAAGAADESRASRLAGEGLYAESVGRDADSLIALAGSIGPLSLDRPEREWIDLTLEILEGRRVDLQRRLSEPVDERYDLVRADQRGVVALRDLLLEWRELEPEDEGFGPEEWFGRLRRLLESNEIALTTPDRRGVQVLEAHEAALGSYRWSFIVHANDGIWPRPRTHRGVFSEEETSRLRELGLPLATPDDVLRRELALWSAVTSLDSVAYTCRAATADGAESFPSLLIPSRSIRLDAESTLVGGRRESVDNGHEGSVPSASHFLAGKARRLDREAAELRHVLLAGGSEPFESTDPAALRQAILTAWSEELRSGRLDGEQDLEEHDLPSLRPHPWGGLIRDPVVASHLREKFGETYTWSASQLEQYGRRPFDFLLDRVLRLTASEEAEESTTPSSRGALAHSILDRFFRALIEEADFPDGPPAELSGPAEAAFERIASEVLDDAEADEEFWLGEPALWRVTRQQIVESIRSFLERELPRLAANGSRPIRLELGFGGQGEGPFILSGRDLEGVERQMRIRGRIDRVDSKPGKDGPELLVLDYKWGAYPQAKGYRDGSVLQMPIYMRVLSELQQLEGVVSRGAYRPITRSTANGAQMKARDVDSVLPFALTIPARVRSGFFEAVQAASQPPGGWQAGPEITRTEARFRDTHRFRLSAHSIGPTGREGHG